MKWLKKLFAVEEINIATSDISSRVAEIQQRIAIIRRSIEQPRKSNKVSQAQSEPPLEATLQHPTNGNDERSKELMDMKAKLLGKNK